MNELSNINSNEMNVMIMRDIPEYDKEDYDLSNTKDFKKYIKDVEAEVRKSREYTVVVAYLKQWMGLNKSPFMRNIEYTDSNRIKIELHHSPFTLYDIVLTVYNKRYHNREPLDVELVALEVTYLHYLFLVGLVPLSKTEHKLVHTQSLFVPLDGNIILGKYEEFVQMYDKFIPENVMDRYKIYKELTEQYNHQENMEVLEVSPTYLQIGNADQTTYLGMYDYGQLQQLATVAQARLENKQQAQIEYNQYDNNPTKMIKPFIVDPKYNEEENK